MDESAHFKCACAHCGETISYLPSQGGQLVECPKCHKKSKLPDAESLAFAESVQSSEFAFKACPICGHKMDVAQERCPECEAKHRRRKKACIIASIAALVLLATGASIYLKIRADREARATALAAAAPKPHIFIGQPTLQPRTGPPDVAKDLLPGRFLLQQRRGSDLIIAVGDIQNNSQNAHQNLRATLDVLDHTGARIGAVTDYMLVLSPREVWHFNAAVTNLNATSVRFNNLKEQQ